MRAGWLPRMPTHEGPHSAGCGRYQAPRCGAVWRRVGSPPGSAALPCSPRCTPGLAALYSPARGMCGSAQTPVGPGCRRWSAWGSSVWDGSSCWRGQQAYPQGRSELSEATVARAPAHARADTQGQLPSLCMCMKRQEWRSRHSRWPRAAPVAAWPIRRRRRSMAGKLAPLYWGQRSNCAAVHTLLRHAAACREAANPRQARQEGKRSNRGCAPVVQEGGQCPERSGK